MKKPIFAIVLAALVLFAASLGLNGVAAANAQRDHMRLLQTILPDGENFVVEPYDGEDENIRSVHKADNGYVIEAATQGYADEIVMLIGVNNAGRVTGLVVREAHETWGLGSKALSDHVFLAQFLNKSGTFAVAGNEADAFSSATGTEEEAGDTIDVDAITGATVTTKAVIRCVNSAVAYVTGADASSGATAWGG